MSKKISVICSFHVFDSVADLSEADRNLLLAAQKTLLNAYAPYSQFSVGAAVRLENGMIVTGNNQENAAYPSGLCAERVAVFYAASQYPDQKITAIAISAASKNKKVDSPISPCGACRQAISEYEVKSDSPIRIIMAGESGEIYISESTANLLPLTFSSKNL